MNTKTKGLYLLVLLLVILTVAGSYYRFMILRDYVIMSQIDCDPESEECFTWICDPEIDGEDYCTGDPEEDTWYFKIAYRNAQNIPDCDQYEDEDCAPFSCPIEGEEDCSEVLCNDDALAEYELDNGCTNPADFYYEPEEEDNYQYEVKIEQEPTKVEINNDEIGISEIASSTDPASEELFE